MTEQEWLTSENPVLMLRELRSKSDLSWMTRSLDNISDRKLRLFACACCRLNPMSKEMQAVAVAERFADGQASAEELHRAGLATVDGGKWTVCSPDALQAAHGILADGHFRGGGELSAVLLRDIVGNPFRPVMLPKVRAERPSTREIGLPRGARPMIPVSPEYDEFTVRPPWLTPQVLSLAQAAYDDMPTRECERCKGKGRWVLSAARDPREVRRYADCPACRGTGKIEDGTLDPVRLAVLADALEEAGCQEEPILRHLRGSEFVPSPDGVGGFWMPKPGPHVRGCWALDLILDKK